MMYVRQTCHILSLLNLLGVWVSRSNPHPAPERRCHPIQEYYSNEREACCRQCPPGSYAFRRCTRELNTQCQTCPQGEYTAFWNYVLKCHLCSPCDHRRGLVVKVNCSTQRNTECQCGEGYHCAPWGNCAECDPHTECGPGEELLQPGSPTLDTVCHECPPGTFQNESTVDKCRRHKNCTALGLVEWKAGSAVSDSICSDPVPTRGPDLKTKSNDRQNNSLVKYYMLPVVLSITILCCVFLAAFFVCIRGSRVCEDSKKETESQNATEDRTSVESKQPLLDSAPGREAPHHHHQQTPERSQDGRTETERLAQRAGPSSPSGPAGGRGRAGTEAAPGPRAHPEHDRMPQAHGDPEGIGGAYGVLGLQGCHVDSLSSKVTVNGPLYIYNGQLSSGAPETGGPQPQDDGCRPPPGLRGAGTAPQQASARGPRNPVCQEASGRDAQRPVQEAGPGPGPDGRPQASGLVTPLQEEGKETHGPEQEELPRTRPEPHWGRRAR